MFDIWKRGVHPFEALRAMTALMPNTPTSALIRSNSLNSMNSQPKDVVRTTNIVVLTPTRQCACESL